MEDTIKTQENTLKNFEENILKLNEEIKFLEKDSNLLKNQTESLQKNIDLIDESDEEIIEEIQRDLDKKDIEEVELIKKELIVIKDKLNISLNSLKNVQGKLTNKCIDENGKFTRGRPYYTPEVVDLVTNLITENFISLNQIGNVVEKAGIFFLNDLYKNNNEICRNTAARMLIVKESAYMILLAQLVSKSMYFWISDDGGCQIERNLHGSSLYGCYVSNGKVQLWKATLGTNESLHFSGEKVAIMLKDHFEFLTSIQKKNGWTVKYLYDIIGVVGDNTSSNTGNLNGFMVIFEKYRSDDWIKHKKVGKCPPLFKLGCHDHISSLMSKEFYKRISQHKDIPSNFLRKENGNEFVFLYVIRTVGNLFYKGSSQHDRIMYDLDSLEDFSGVFFDKFNPIRFNSFLNMCSNVLKYKSNINVILQDLINIKDPSINQSLYDLFQSPICHFLLKIMDYCSNNITKPMMKMAVEVKIFNEYKIGLDKIQSQINSIIPIFSKMVDEECQVSQEYSQVKSLLKVIYICVYESFEYQFKKWTFDCSKLTNLELLLPIVCSTRSEERLQKLFKDYLSKNSYTRLEILDALLKLSTAPKELKFNLSSIPKEIFNFNKARKIAREKLDNSTTRFERNNEKVTEVLLEIAQKKDQIAESLKYNSLKDEIHKLPTNIFAYSTLKSTQAVTVAWMKEILSQFKEFKLYKGNLQGNKDEIYQKLEPLVKQWNESTLKLPNDYKFTSSQQMAINVKLSERKNDSDTVQLRTLA